MKSTEFLKLIYPLASLLANTYALPQPGGGTWDVDDDEVSTPAPPTPPLTQFPAGFQFTKLRTPEFDSTCSSSQRQLITTWFTQALKMVQYVVDNTATTRQGMPFTTFMDATGEEGYFNDVMEVFKHMERDLAQGSVGGEVIKISCGNDEGCSGKTLAFATPSKHSIHFCPLSLPSWTNSIKELFGYKNPSPPDFDSFRCTAQSSSSSASSSSSPSTGVTATNTNTNGLKFDFKASGMDPNQIESIYELPSRAVVHELSHLYKFDGNGFITDCFYGAYASEFMARYRQVASTANADSYAWFAVANYVSNLCPGDDTPATLLRTVEDDGEGFKDAWQEFQDNAVEWARLQKLAVDGDKGAEARQKVLKGDWDSYRVGVCNLNPRGQTLTWAMIEREMGKRTDVGPAIPQKLKNVANGR